MITTRKIHDRNILVLKKSRCKEIVEKTIVMQTYFVKTKFIKVSKVININGEYTNPTLGTCIQ